MACRTCQGRFTLHAVTGWGHSFWSMTAQGLHVIHRGADVLTHAACMAWQAKTQELKQSLGKEFRSIHELCLFVLNASQKADLVRATLATLAAYLTWVPLGYVLESNIVELLLKLFPPPATRNLSLQCLTEARTPALLMAAACCAVHPCRSCICMCPATGSVMPELCGHIECHP